LGGGCSLFFLIIFFFLQSRHGPLAEIHEAFLWFSLVPLVIGLFMGGFITAVKWGELQVGLGGLPKGLAQVEGQSLPGAGPPAAPDSKSPEKAGTEAPPAPAPTAAGGDDLEKTYSDEYEKRTRHYMLAHICQAVKAPGWFDVSIFVVRHLRGSSGPPKFQLEEISKAEFHLGPSWPEKCFPVQNTGGLIGIRTRSWGTFLASCKLTFKDGSAPVMLFRYIDFYMDPAYREESLP